MSELPLAPLKRIVKSVEVTGRTPGIGEEALELFRDEVERYAQKLAAESAIMAATMGKTNIKPHDIEVAVHKISMTLTYDEPTIQDIGVDEH